ncbi:MAG: tRNA (adenosine(37)-N6)-threonylcarbamoyltransferase complex ATPase subunit type 1 TsaE [Myxococcota bacterium]|jgi:tRNA threonylcarbamoyladenosine biosynthesis protein TsaE|nr:tRNA (adenosine(37)-N6)-threonylcarbamoyltransferase complex ATPase subunit type 1 TsaE [Myxococcota bacterium]
MASDLLPLDAPGLQLASSGAAPGSRLTIHSASAEATRLLGEALGRLLGPGTLLRLQGDLGAGKTVFCQGLAWGLGVPRTAYVNSPSFTYVREHRSGRIPFFHVDLYRVSDPEELDLIGLRDYLDGRGVCAVEWPERAHGWLPEQGLAVRIEDCGPETGTARRISLHGLDGSTPAILATLDGWLVAAAPVAPIDAAPTDAAPSDAVPGD